MNTTLNIGLAGLGTVGGGLVRLLSENAEEIRARSGCDFNLKAVAVRNPNRKRDLPEGVRLTTDPMTLADDPDIDVVIELMGGIDTAKELITRSLAKGKQVVTANKALLAEEGESLFRLADEKGATLLYEASVAGGIPIVQTLKESLTGNHITSLEGILNGTGNYILSEMTSKGVNFAPALAEAQEKGYAEADPTLDIDGFDTAHKLVLLIRLAWGVDYPYTKMPIEGIRNLDKMDIDFAREFGYRIKLLGRARMRDGKLEAGVFPTLVNHTYLLARVGGAYNAVRVEGNAVGSLFLHGLGAGSLPTASSILSDIMARLNNYRYEYKKMNYIEKPDYTTDITLKIYARYKETDVQGILNFSKIHEQFISEESNYVIGEIPLRELLEKRAQLSGRDVFLANIPIFFLNRD